MRYNVLKIWQYKVIVSGFSREWTSLEEMYYFSTIWSTNSLNKFLMYLGYS